MPPPRLAAQRTSDPADASVGAKLASDAQGRLYEITVRGRTRVYGKATRCHVHDESSARQLINRLRLAPNQWVQLLLDVQLQPERMFFDEREIGPWLAQLLSGGSIEVFRVPQPERKLAVPGPKALAYCFLPAPALPNSIDARAESISTIDAAKELLRKLNFSRVSWPALFKAAGHELPAARYSAAESEQRLATLLAEGKVVAYALRNLGSPRSTAAARPSPGGGGGGGSGGSRGAGGAGGSGGSSAPVYSGGGGAGGTGGSAPGPATGAEGAGGGPAPLPEPVKTGLEEAVDKLAAQSPTLQSDLKKLQADGWKVDYGTSGAGSFADRTSVPPKITIDGALKGATEQATQTLAHEVGHALHDYKADYTSKEKFLSGTLGDEGAATLKNIQVQREILKNGGPDIGIAGLAANHPAYNAAYDQLQTAASAANATEATKAAAESAARDAIGKVFGTGETTSTTGQSYADYYGGWYDKNFPPKP